MNQYREQALKDCLDEHAQFILEKYETAEALEEDIQSGDYDGQIYLELGQKRNKVIANLRLEKGEGKYCIFEGSTWIVAWYNILNRWYAENKAYFDKCTNYALRG